VQGGEGQSPCVAVSRAAHFPVVSLCGRCTCLVECQTAPLTTHQFTTQVRFETKIVVTDVSEREELLGQIEALSPDLVVVGRRGLGALAKCVISPVFKSISASLPACNVPPPHARQVGHGIHL
jgi:hypothetical protein